MCVSPCHAVAEGFPNELAPNQSGTCDRRAYWLWRLDSRTDKAAAVTSFPEGFVELGPRQTPLHADLKGPRPPCHTLHHCPLHLTFHSGSHRDKHLRVDETASACKWNPGKMMPRDRRTQQIGSLWVRALISAALYRAPLVSRVVLHVLTADLGSSQSYLDKADEQMNNVCPVILYQCILHIVKNKQIICY